MMKNKLQHVFKISHEDFDGTLLEGSFTCKKLSISETTKLGVIKAQLNGGMHYDDDKPGAGIDAQTDALNTMTAHVRLALVSAPTWFDLDEIYDLELLALIYKEVREFENSFRRRREGNRAQVSGSVSQAGSVSVAEPSDKPGTFRKVVANEVQASLEP